MVSEAKGILTQRLNKSVEPTVTVRSVYGHYFPNLVYLDRDWVIENLDKIFPLEENESEYWWASWETYITFCDIFNDVYDILKERYRFALSRFSNDQDVSRSSHDDADKLSQHLMLLYLRGKESLADDQSLIKELFRLAPSFVKARAINFIGWCIRFPAGKKGPIDLLRRMEELWDYRISDATSAENDFP